MPPNRVSRLLSLALAIALVASACAGSSDTSAPTPEQSALSSIQGTWLCEVQRFAFDDLSEIDTRLDESLGAAGFTRRTYDTFMSDLATRPDLRQLVAKTFNEACER